MKTQIYVEFASAFCALLRSTIIEVKITSLALQDAIDSKLNYLNLIASYLHSALFFVELIEPTEGLSLIHSCS